MNSRNLGSSATLTQLGPLSEELVRIHDPRSGYDALSVQGLEFYPERALLCRGTTLISRTVPDSHIRLLRDTDTGASGALVNQSDAQLLDAISPRNRSRILELVEDGCMIELGQSTPKLLRLLARIGIDSDTQVWNPPAAAAYDVNHKIRFRRLCEGLPGSAVRFPEYVILPVTNRQAVKEAVRGFFTTHGGAFVKHPLLASGDGLYGIRPGPNWEAKLNLAFAKFEHRGYDGEVIVDAAYWDHTPLSAQVVIDNSGPRVLGLTEQQIESDTVHAGNRISSEGLPGFPGWVAEQMEIQSLELATERWRQGYRGYLGYDFILTAEAQPQLLCIEGNGRVTGAMNPLALALQSQEHGQSHWSVVSDNVITAGLDYEQVLGVLRGQGVLYDGRVGIMPACPGLLNRHHKAMLYSVAEDFATADGQLRLVSDLIGTEA